MSLLATFSCRKAGPAPNVDRGTTSGQPLVPITLDAVPAEDHTKMMSQLFFGAANLNLSLAQDRWFIPDLCCQGKGLVRN